MRKASAWAANRRTEDSASDEDAGSATVRTAAASPAGRRTHERPPPLPRERGRKGAFAHHDLPRTLTDPPNGAGPVGTGIRPPSPDISLPPINNRWRCPNTLSEPEYTVSVGRFDAVPESRSARICPHRAGASPPFGTPRAGSRVERSAPTCSPIRGTGSRFAVEGIPPARCSEFVDLPIMDGERAQRAGAARVYGGSAPPGRTPFESPARHAGEGERRRYHPDRGRPGGEARSMSACGKHVERPVASALVSFDADRSLVPGSIRRGAGQLRARPRKPDPGQSHLRFFTGRMATLAAGRFHGRDAITRLRRRPGSRAARVRTGCNRSSAR